MTTIRERETAFVIARRAVGVLVDELSEALEATQADGNLTDAGKAARARQLGQQYRETLANLQEAEAEALDDYRQAVEKEALSTPGEHSDVMGTKPRRGDYLKADGAVDAVRFREAMASWREDLPEAAYTLAAKRDAIERLERLPSNVLATLAADAGPTDLQALREIVAARAASAPEAVDTQDREFLGQDIDASLLLERSLGTLRAPTAMEPGTWDLCCSVAARESADLTGEQAAARDAIADGKHEAKATTISFAGAGIDGLAHHFNQGLDGGDE